jgi:hypothetical protein
MDVRYVQIVPIELYSEANREAARSALFQERLIHKSMTDSELRDLVHEISPTGTEFYSVRIDGHRRATVDIVFCETTLCLVVVHDLGEGHALDFDLLDHVLTRRATEHAEIIAQKNALIQPVMDCLNARFSNGRYPIRPNYVFGFCCLCRDARLSEDCKSILKVMSEPSIVDVDDMLSSTRRALVAADLPPSDHRVFGRVVDVDPSTKSTTYVTWASIVSYTMDQGSFERTLHLLIALQVRLQSTWNRCYSFRLLSDDVLSGSHKNTDIEALFWQFARVLDDARSVLSSTFSSRADQIFRAMVRTSNLDGEISRLNTKLHLVRDYIETVRQKRSLLYQKTVEMLLFVAAVASVMQVLLPVPVIESASLSYTILICLVLVGVFAILKSGR